MAFAITLSLAAGFSACTESPEPASPRALRPLQPLVYTEQPTLSPEASGVRERRMLRRFRQGANSSGSWGQMPTAKDRSHPPIQDPAALGEAIFGALIERDESAWDALFVPPEDYARLVRVDLDDARKFVDTLQASSLTVWRAFKPGLASEAPEGGLGSVLEVVELQLGEGRRVDGPVAQEDEVVAQYWENILRLRLRGSDLVFELKIPKILRTNSASHIPQAARLSLGSPIKMSPLLDIYTRAGLHLKTQLLETREYPYPLAVGNFWRYQRSRLSQGDDAREAVSAESAPPGSQPIRSEDAGVLPGGLAATETLLEVVSVDRYGSRRLVTLRRSYNDEALTTSYQHLLLLPKRIYRCSQRCRSHIKDLGWLLKYLDSQTPIYVFPLGLNKGWGAGGQATTGKDGSTQPKTVFEVGSDWQDVQTPGGAYTNTVEIRGVGPLGGLSPYYRGREQTRYFAYGHGLVQRVLRETSERGDRMVVEKLVESRIMPR